VIQGAQGGSEQKWPSKDDPSGTGSSAPTTGPRQDKVLEYVIHRIEDGANLREVLQEEYVRRNATADEVQSLLENPRLIQAAGEQLREDFSSGELDPRQKRP
jgi:hypothetical protein